MKFHYTNPEYWEKAGVLEYLLFCFLLCLLATVATTYLVFRFVGGRGDIASDAVSVASLYFVYRSVRAAAIGFFRKG